MKDMFFLRDNSPINEEYKRNYKTNPITSKENVAETKKKPLRNMSTPKLLRSAKRAIRKSPSYHANNTAEKLGDKVASKPSSVSNSSKIGDDSFRIGGMHSNSKIDMFSNEELKNP